MCGCVRRIYRQVGSLIFKIVPLVFLFFANVVCALQVNIIPPIIFKLFCVPLMLDLHKFHISLQNSHNLHTKSEHNMYNNGEQENINLLGRLKVCRLGHVFFSGCCGRKSRDSNGAKFKLENVLLALAVKCKNVSYHFVKYS